MIRAVVIGVGAHARNVHLPVLKAMPDVELVGVADVSEQALAETSRVFTVGKTFRDHRQMLDRLKPDVAYVLTMPKHTCALVLDCLERGVHTFCEKPLGRSTQEARQMAEAGARNGCRTMVAFNRRFMPVLLDSLHQLRGVGHRRFVYFFTMHSGWNAPDDVHEHSHFVEKYGADFLLLDVCHQVDMARWLGGEVGSIHAHIERFGRVADMDWALQLEFAEGGTAHIWSSNLPGDVYGSSVERYDIHYEGASAFIEVAGGGVFSKLLFATPEKDVRIIQSPRSVQSLLQWGFHGEHRHFLDCVAAGKRPSPDFDDGVRTMELIDRVREAAREASAGGEGTSSANR
jgi:predicted dehydrogenase